jgi:hypothetical protein
MDSTLGSEICSECLIVVSVKKSPGGGEPPTERSGALRGAPISITYWGDFLPGARHLLLSMQPYFALCRLAAKRAIWAK